jgi:hypothetical protein
MAEKKSKVKVAAPPKISTSKASTSKTATPKAAMVKSAKGTAVKAAPAKAAASKSASPKPASSRPTALQTVSKKPATAKSAKSTPKPSKTAAQRAAINGRAQSTTQRPGEPETETFYLVVSHMDARISNEKLLGGAEIASSDSFAEVKDKAVDHLIALVDLLERRLWEIKRAQDFASYQALVEVD